ncbi:sigma factor-like helix-turn-helix DNA-binding protein [Cellulomonas massiliensis]|uniref:sigma factor-like helix-turn-helix DNA-binding protein n=1 Tax=Cellulomonas massiliensis TaxID=1465811 RepID=UPI0002DB19F1|nr:sigma factor-like helix-turn-helix DNA-binding protein [Cellulomonas massiliensis]
MAWEPMLTAVVQERYPRLVAYASLLAGSYADGQDLVQEALVATFSGRARFDTAAEAEQYVRRAVASRFVDRTRRRRTERAAWATVGAWREGAPPQPVGGAAGELERALQQLPPRQRACVVLRYLEDLSVRSTAEVLGLSEGAVKRYTSDGLAALKGSVDVTVPAEETAPVRMTTEVRDA